MPAEPPGPRTKVSPFAYRQLTTLEEEPRSGWSYVVAQIPVKAARVALSVCAPYPLTLLARPILPSGFLPLDGYWLPILLYFVLTNLAHFVFLPSEDDEPTRLASAWRRIVGSQLDGDADLILLRAADRTNTQTLIALVVAIVCCILGGAIVSSSAEVTDVVGWILVVLITVAAFGQNSNKDASAFHDALATAIDDRASMSAGESVVDLLGPSSPCVAVTCPKNRLLMRPNVWFASTLARWKLITAITGVATASILLWQFGRQIYEVVGASIAPITFGVTFATLAMVTRVVFWTRDSSFRAVCFRSFSPESGRVSRSVLVPTIGCFGHVSVVWDKMMEENPSLADEYLESGRHDPGDIALFLPDLLVGRSTFYKFTNDEWQVNVARILDTADLVVVDVSPGITPGVRWELEESTSRLPQERIILLSQSADYAELAKTIVRPASGDPSNATLLLYEDTFLGRAKLRADLMRAIRELAARRTAR